MNKITSELERFIVNNNDLEKLEIELNKFNIFEKLSLQYYEIRHSNTLAYLFNPKEDHGLSDYFIKRFLVNVYSNSSTNISPITIDSMDLSDVIIKREYKNTDILIISKRNSLVICIENKILSSESENQLITYKKSINSIFPKYKKGFIFLSPTGIEPSDTDNWIVADYEIINRILSNILTLKSDDLGDQQNTFLTHYLTIIRRYLLEKTNEKELARKIYSNHKKALNFIFDNIADQRSEIYDFIVELINKDNNLILSYSTKSRIRFQTKFMDSLPKKGNGEWNKVSEVLLFEVQNNTDFINLILVLGPANSDYRENIFNELKKGFIEKYLKSNTKLSSKFNTIYKEELITKEDYNILDIEDIKKKIKDFFSNSELNHFLEIDNYFKKITDKF